MDGVSQGTQTLAVGSGLSLYGTATYGTGTYAGSGRRQGYLIHPLAADGRTYVQRLVYAGQEAERIFSYHPGMVPESASRSLTE